MTSARAIDDVQVAIPPGGEEQARPLWRDHDVAAVAVRAQAARYRAREGELFCNRMEILKPL